MSSLTSAGMEEESRKVLKPLLSASDVASALRSCYSRSFDAFRVVEELESYDDCNWLVEKEQKETEATAETSKYVFKAHNGADSEGEGGLQLLQQRCMDAVNGSEGLRTSGVVLSDDGLPFVRLKLRVNSGEDRVLACKVLDYVPGRLLKDCRVDETAVVAAGEYLARLDSALDGLSLEPGCRADKAAKRDHQWDARHTLSLEPFLRYVEDGALLKAVKGVIQSFRMAGIRDDKMRKGIIMADFNDCNVVMEDRGGKYAVKGVIDWGDVVER